METENPNQIPPPIATPTPEERASALLRAAEGVARKAEDERHARAMASLGEQKQSALATVAATDAAIVTELARHKAAGEEIAGAAIARIEAALKASPLVASSSIEPPPEKPKVTRRRLSEDEVKRAKELVLAAIHHFGGTCSTGDIVDRVAHLSDSERAAGLRVLVAEGKIYDASVKQEGKKVKTIWKLGPAPGAPMSAAAPAAQPAEGGAV